MNYVDRDQETEISQRKRNGLSQTVEDKISEHGLTGQPQCWSFQNLKNCCPDIFAVDEY